MRARWTSTVRTLIPRWYAINLLGRNFPLAWTEGCDPPDGVADFAVAIEPGFSAERRLDRSEQRMIAVWFFQEIACARLHRANSGLNISLAGHHNDCEVASYLEQLDLDIQSAHARQADIQQDASGLERPGCRQKRVRTVERDRLEVRRTQQTFQRPKHGVVIIQNVDGSFSRHLPLRRTEG
jgi:hypothetical protein